MAILRGVTPADAVARASTAWASGIELVEVTIEREEGLEALAAVCAAAEGNVVGAGTVTTPERLSLATKLGAGFAVAPGLDPDTVHAAEEKGLPFLPGVATPTEVGAAVRLGLRTLKAFPASALGVGWIRAIRGPFPEVRLVATGGVGATNGQEMLEAGAVAIGAGAALDADFLTTLRRSAAQ